MMCFVRELIFRCGKEGGWLIMFLRKFMNVFFFSCVLFSGQVWYFALISVDHSSVNTVVESANEKEYSEQHVEVLHILCLVSSISLLYFGVNDLFIS